MELNEGTSTLKVVLKPIVAPTKAHLALTAIRRETGSPVGGAKVYSVGIDTPSFTRTGYTNVSGLYYSVFPLGRYEVEVSKSGYWGWKGEVRIVAGETLELTVKI